jgi:hypothetical protein
VKTHLLTFVFALGLSGCTAAQLAQDEAKASAALKRIHSFIASGAASAVLLQAAEEMLALDPSSPVLQRRTPSATSGPPPPTKERMSGLEKITDATADQVRAVLDWVLVKLDPLPSESEGGIRLLENRCTVLDATFGHVVSIGPGRTNDHGAFVPTTGKVGWGCAFLKRVDHRTAVPVTFLELAPQSWASSDYWFLREDEILAWFEE